MQKNNLKGKKALVMGLGLHGGGLESVRYLLSCGAEVSCTDLRDAETLEPSLKELKGKPVRFVFGEHRMEDFDNADIIIKNPAVPADSKWLAGRNNIETDISLFLKSTSAPIIAVTGSKGKSTVVTALQHILKKQHPDVKLGGNITVSPLSFINELKEDTPVILELSSWQLADLKGRNILKPRIACITNLMHDHQNRYASFADYEADKTIIYENLCENGFTVFPDDTFGRKWAEEADGKTVLVNTVPGETVGTVPGFPPPEVWMDDENRGWFKADEDKEQILPPNLRVPGAPFRGNMLFAAAIARLWGCRAETIIEAQQGFTGVPYRMELFLEKGGICFYDDTAATIPDASAAAVSSMNVPVVLVAGGTNKELDFTPFTDIATIPRRIVFLKGSATDILIPMMKELGASVEGPYDDMNTAVEAAIAAAKPGDSIILSPGAASFGMFRHEFERGDAFKKACRKAVSDKL